MDKKRKNKNDILTIAAIIGLIGSAVFRTWSKIAAPGSFIGEENLLLFRRFLVLEALGNIFTAAFVCSLMLPWAMAFWEIYQNNHALKRELKKIMDAKSDLPVRESRGWLIMIAFVMFSLLIIGVAGIFLFSRGGAVACFGEAVRITYDLSSGKRGTVSEIEDVSVALYSADNGKLAFGEGCTMTCRDSEGREYFFPLSKMDAKHFIEELYKYKYKNRRFRAEYCIGSGVITEYEFCGTKKPSYVETQEEADRTFGRVEISLEVGEDYVYACRPPEMSQNTAWVIKRDGELVNRSQKENEGYTIFAQYYEKLDIDADIMLPGNYEVYFVRYGNGNVFRLSGSYFFEIEEYMGDPVDIRFVEAPEKG